MKRRRSLTGAVTVFSLIAWIFTVLIWVGVNFGGRPGHRLVTLGNKSVQVDFGETIACLRVRDTLPTTVVFVQSGTSNFSATNLEFHKLLVNNWGMQLGSGFAADNVTVPGPARFPASRLWFAQMTYHWLLAILTLTGILCAYFTLPKHQPPPGFCRNCGYDMRATPDRCPECGTNVSVPPLPGAGLGGYAGVQAAATGTISTPAILGPNCW